MTDTPTPDEVFAPDDQAGAAHAESGPRTHGSSTLTKGVRVEVRPQYMPGESLPGQRRYAFAYHIRITNERDDTVQLLTRHWRIVDASGSAHEVDGEGVVGQQPTLTPGESFEYASWCPMTTTWGTMEGHFTFRGEAEEQFDVSVGRFYLVVKE